MPVWASVCLAWTRGVLGQYLLTGEGRVAAPATVRVTADITVRVPHIVPVFLVESVVRDLVKCGTPKDQALLQVQTEPFEEECVLQSTVMLEMRVSTQRPV